MHNVGLSESGTMVEETADRTNTGTTDDDFNPLIPPRHQVAIPIPSLAVAAVATASRGLQQHLRKAEHDTPVALGSWLLYCQYLAEFSWSQSSCSRWAKSAKETSLAKTWHVRALE